MRARSICLDVIMQDDCCALPMPECIPELRVLQQECSDRPGQTDRVAVKIGPTPAARYERHSPGTRNSAMRPPGLPVKSRPVLGRGCLLEQPAGHQLVLPSGYEIAGVRGHCGRNGLRAHALTETTPTRTILFGDHPPRQRRFGQEGPNTRTAISPRRPITITCRQLLLHRSTRSRRNHSWNHAFHFPSPIR